MHSELVPLLILDFSCSETKIFKILSEISNQAKIKTSCMFKEKSFKNNLLTCCFSFHVIHYISFKMLLILLITFDALLN